jgi:hypothetical protein
MDVHCLCRQTGICKLGGWPRSSREDLLVVTREIRKRPCSMMIYHIGINLLKYKDVDILVAISCVKNVLLMRSMTASFFVMQPREDLHLVERFICSYDNLLHPPKMLRVILDNAIKHQLQEIFVSALLKRRGASEDGTEYMNILKADVARGRYVITCTNPVYQRCLAHGLGYECFRQLFEADTWALCHKAVISSADFFNAAPNCLVRMCKNDIRICDMRHIIDVIGIEGVIFNGIADRITLSSVNWVTQHHFPFFTETMSSLSVRDLATLARLCKAFKYEDRREMPRCFRPVVGPCQIELDSDDSD